MNENKYIVIKTIAGVLSILIIVCFITLIFDILVLINGMLQGFPVNFFDLWIYVIICIVPIITFITCFYIFINTIFKSPIPACPLLLLFMYRCIFISC